MPLAAILPQAHVLEQEVSAIVFGGAPPQLGANAGAGAGGHAGGAVAGRPFAACRDCGAQLQLVLNAEGPPSILCSSFPMHRLRIDLPRCTAAVAISGGDRQGMRQRLCVGCNAWLRQGKGARLVGLSCETEVGGRTAPPGNPN